MELSVIPVIDMTVVSLVSENGSVCNNIMDTDMTVKFQKKEIRPLHHDIIDSKTLTLKNAKRYLC